MSRAVLAGLFAGLVGFSGAASAATTYNITIGGFNGGGTLVISLAGTDTNNDGQLEWSSGGSGDMSELTALSATFSGNSIIPDFTLSYTLAELQGSSSGHGGLYYTPGASFAAAGNGFGLSEGGFSVSGGSLLYSCGTSTCYEVQETSPSETVSSAELGAESETSAAVPEPASWAMMVGGFGLIGGTLRRKRAIAVRFG